MADMRGFDANTVEPMGDYELLPAGRYPAVITDSAELITRNGDGSFLKLTFEITDGPHKGRLQWTRLNLDNPNPKAVEIARGELSAICRAVGVLTPGDSSELHNRPLTIGVKVSMRRDTGEPGNEVKGYWRPDGKPAATPPKPAVNHSAVSGAPAKPPVSVASPWGRPKPDDGDGDRSEPQPAAVVSPWGRPRATAPTSPFGAATPVVAGIEAAKQNLGPAVELDAAGTPIPPDELGPNGKRLPF